MKRSAAARARGYLNSFRQNNCLSLPNAQLTANQATLIGHLVCSRELVVRGIPDTTGALAGILVALPDAQIWSAA